MADKDEQLALIHIGVVIGNLLEVNMIPDTLDEAADIMKERLGITLAKGVKLEDLRTQVINAYITIYGEGNQNESNISDFDRAMKGI